MSQKLKSHKNKHQGKGQILAKTTIASENEVVNNTAMQEQFESELLWCIQQLQAAINSGKLNKRQMEDSTKTLNSLMSNTTPVIKKRQLMRLSFGDYRSKMSAEEAKYSKVNSKIVVSSEKPSKKSTFLKEAAATVKDNVPDVTQLTITDNTASGSFRYRPSTNSFRFDFQN